MTMEASALRADEGGSGLFTLLSNGHESNINVVGGVGLSALSLMLLFLLFSASGENHTHKEHNPTRSVCLYLATHMFIILSTYMDQQTSIPTSQMWCKQNKESVLSHSSHIPNMDV